MDIEDRLRALESRYRTNRHFELRAPRDRSTPLSAILLKRYVTCLGSHY
jgi:hypothetical protein